MSEKRGAEELYDEVYEKLDEKTKYYLKDHADMVTVAKKPSLLTTVLSNLPPSLQAPK